VTSVIPAQAGIQGALGPRLRGDDTEKGRASGPFVHFNGIPVGWMYPSFQATRMQTNSRMENPTRNASARTMLPVLGRPSSPSRIMKNSAEPRLAMIARKATMTKYFMPAIIRAGRKACSAAS